MSHARRTFTAAAGLLLLGLVSAQNLRATGSGPQTQQQPQAQDTRPPRPTEEVLSPTGVVSAPQTAEVSPMDPSSSTSIAAPPKPVAASVPVSTPTVEQPPLPLAQPQAGGSEMEGTVRFVMPTINGLPVDYCSEYQHSDVPSERRGIDCGLPAADRYCRSQGYDGATEDFIVTYYSNRATLTMADVSLHAADPPGYGKGRHTFFTSITCRFSGHAGEGGGVTADMAVVPSAVEGRDGGVHRL